MIHCQEGGRFFFFPISPSPFYILSFPVAEITHFNSYSFSFSSWGCVVETEPHIPPGLIVEGLQNQF